MIVAVTGESLDRLLTEVRSMESQKLPIFKLSLRIEEDYWCSYKINGHMWSPPYGLEEV